MFEHLRQELYQEHTEKERKKRQSHRQAETDNFSWHVETVKVKIISTFGVKMPMVSKTTKILNIV